MLSELWGTSWQRNTVNTYFHVPSHLRHHCNCNRDLPSLKGTLDAIPQWKQHSIILVFMLFCTGRTWNSRRVWNLSEIHGQCTGFGCLRTCVKENIQRMWFTILTWLSQTDWWASNTVYGDWGHILLLSIWGHASCTNKLFIFAMCFIHPKRAVHLIHRYFMNLCRLMHKIDQIQSERLWGINTLSTRYLSTWNIVNMHQVQHPNNIQEKQSNRSSSAMWETWSDCYV